MRRQYGARPRSSPQDRAPGGLAGLFTGRQWRSPATFRHGGQGRKEDLEEVKKILADARREQSLQLILKEIQALKQDLGRP
jgi:hypothetical protein